MSEFINRQIITHAQVFALGLFLISSLTLVMFNSHVQITCVRGKSTFFSIIASWLVVLCKKTSKHRLRSYDTEEEHCEAAGAGGEAGGRGGRLGQRKPCEGAGYKGQEGGG